MLVTERLYCCSDMEIYVKGKFSLNKAFHLKYNFIVGAHHLNLCFSTLPSAVFLDDSHMS